jgi:hypothetical protein
MVQPASWKDGNLAAPRAPDLRLNVDKLSNALGFNPPAQVSGLQRFRDLHAAGYPQRLLEMGKAH